MPRPARADPIFKLRLPDHLREELETKAAENRRSLTAEILGRLELSLSEYSERLKALEDEVWHTDRGNEALDGRLDVLEAYQEGRDPYEKD